MAQLLIKLDGPARNPSSVQRGSVSYISNYVGGKEPLLSFTVKYVLLIATDPTTPGYPSKPGVKRTDGSGVLPKIPSLPISYRDAVPLLNLLQGHGKSGPEVGRDGWMGGLKNISYSTG